MIDIKIYELDNPCKHSFVDLLLGSGEDTDTKELYAMSQKKRNEKVKELCKKASWYWQDITGSDGIIYTAFSPNIKYS
jgi:hypothetical protein